MPNPLAEDRKRGRGSLTWIIELEDIDSIIILALVLLFIRRSIEFMQVSVQLKVIHC